VEFWCLHLHAGGTTLDTSSSKSMETTWTHSHWSCGVTHEVLQKISCIHSHAVEPPSIMVGIIEQYHLH